MRDFEANSRLSRKSFALWTSCAAFVALTGGPSLAEAAASYSIEVVDRGTRHTRTISSATLYRAVVALVKSSESSDTPEQRGGSQLSDRELHASYREEVRGGYMILSFPEPRELETAAGRISVAEIVVGLNREDHVSSLFTIDGAGLLTGHAIYSDALAARLLRAVQAVPEAPATYGRARWHKRASLKALSPRG
jgi:hypothetical protein